MPQRAQRVRHLLERSEHVHCPTRGVTTASPYDSTMYTVTFTDENGCQGMTRLWSWLTLLRMLVFLTAFSRNGDGFNDILNM